MNDPYTQALFLAHIASTLFMTGLIWFVQVAHYPLLGRVAPHDVPRYEQAHTRLATWVVAPPMLAELVGCCFCGFGPPACRVYWLGRVSLFWASSGARRSSFRFRATHGCHARSTRPFTGG